MNIKDIFYNGTEAYLIVRTIKISDCDPRQYEIQRTDEEAHMKVLQVWRDYHNCDHVLKRDNNFMLCRTIKDAEIVE